MELLTVTPSVPKALPANAKTWVTSWLPEISTQKWTAGAGGAHYRSPLDVWMGKYIVPAQLVVAFEERMRDDWTQRGLFDMSCLSPTFNSLTPYMNGKNLHDPLHFGGMTILDHLDRIGSAWAGNAAIRLFSSYYVNGKATYLRDGGNPSMPYMDQGRLRVAGWALMALWSLSTMFKRWGVTGYYADLVVSLVYSHLKRIKEHWPLIAVPDGPNGDHLNVPHLETFMLGILGNALRRIKSLGYDVLGMDAAATSLISAAQVAPLTYVYDLRVDEGGNPLPAEPTDPTRNGCSGVNFWIVGACSDEEQAALHGDAIAQGLPTKYPHIMANHFGE